MSYWREVLELLGQNGEHWMKGAYTDLVRGRGTCYCLVGAIRRVGSAGNPEVWRWVVEDAREELGTSVVKWNDAPSRAWPEVKALIERMIEREENGSRAVHTG